MSDLVVEETPLDGLLIVKPKVHGDERGFFLEPYRAEVYEPAGIDVTAQDNHSRSGHKVLRGLHFQTDPGQNKLMRCGRGRIWDVAVDLRRSSPTFGRWFGMELDDVTHHQLYVPNGFGHGFVVLSDVADVLYKTSSPYRAETEAEIAWNDPDIGIDWPVADPILSSRDVAAPRLADFDWSTTAWQS
jgi:dTDP-4-dehydrorhamnose 3,5-epimerase